MYLSEITIKQYLTSAYAKMGVDGRDYLAAALDKTGLGWRTVT
jgi:DNA-binding CsgD family transcriptional regulator